MASKLDDTDLEIGRWLKSLIPLRRSASLSEDLGKTQVVSSCALLEDFIRGFGLLARVRIVTILVHVTLAGV